MEVIIDRFETDYAIIELPNGNAIQAPRDLFPFAIEGDIFTISKNDSKSNERRKYLQEKFDKLKK